VNPVIGKLQFKKYQGILLKKKQAVGKTFCEIEKIRRVKRWGEFLLLGSSG